MFNIERYLEFSPEIIRAREKNMPLVALESTIISHGMPYPDNVKTARKVEDIIRKTGALPATIAILDGKIKVGLKDEEVEFLGKAQDVAKVSRRDLAYILSGGNNGATTVASTMIIAKLAGIKIFVTGGIGGAHRGAEDSFDISADLMELARTNVAVVCAGAKSILDLGLTLEVLETHGVPIIGYRTGEFPAFYARESGYKVDHRVEDVDALANILKTKWSLGLNGGLVVANPVPQAYAMDGATINKAINQALLKAEEEGIKGKDVTPFLLDKVKEITGGKSLETNIQLVYNNARLGGQLAVKYKEIRGQNL